MAGPLRVCFSTLVSDFVTLGTLNHYNTKKESRSHKFSGTGVSVVGRERQEGWEETADMASLVPMQNFSQLFWPKAWASTKTPLARISSTLRLGRAERLRLGRAGASGRRTRSALG